MSIRAKLIVNQELFCTESKEQWNKNPEIYILVLSVVSLWLDLACGHLIINIEYISFFICLWICYCRLSHTCKLQSSFVWSVLNFSNTRKRNVKSAAWIDINSGPFWLVSWPEQVCWCLWPICPVPVLLRNINYLPAQPGADAKDMILTAS